MSDIEKRTPLALYRKYRPTSFNEVLGQEAIVSVLKAAVEQKKLAHAYLFAGSRGTGKTSIARILARAVGTSDRDVYEMDAASNRGIEEIRELREGISTLPFESTYKFYILDEAHALTPQAWGALLKTLEEPPEHVVFVLATTELDKVPETIVSRCQTFQFSKPSHEILKSYIIDVAKKEKLKLDPAGAELIALMGDGSFRDTLGILQKVLTISNDVELTETEIAKVIGAPSGKTVNDFLDTFISKDITKALIVFHAALASGIDAKVFSLLVITKMRGILLMRFAPEMIHEIKEQFSEDDIKSMTVLAEKAKVINARTLSELITAHLQMDRTPIPSIPLELALYAILSE